MRRRGKSQKGANPDFDDGEINANSGQPQTGSHLAENVRHIPTFGYDGSCVGKTKCGALETIAEVAGSLINEIGETPDCSTGNVMVDFVHENLRLVDVESVLEDPRGFGPK